MGDYNSNFRPGGRSSGGYRGRNSGGRSFGGRDEGPRMMHKAVCAQCGRECEVPFRPTGDRPVYCSDCFEKRSNEGGEYRRDDRGFGGRPQFQDRRPDSRPPTDRPVNQGNNVQMMQEMRNLNAKLDRILRVLEPQAPQVAQVPQENKFVETSVVDSIISAPEMAETIVIEPKAKKAKTAAKKKEPEVKTEA